MSLRYTLHKRASNRNWFTLYEIMTIFPRIDDVKYFLNNILTICSAYTALIDIQVSFLCIFLCIRMGSMFELCDRFVRTYHRHRYEIHRYKTATPWIIIRVLLYEYICETTVYIFRCRIVSTRSPYQLGNLIEHK